MEKQQFTGKNLNDALAQASKALGADVHALSYNIIPSSGGGLFSKIFSRGVKLEVWIEDKIDLQEAARAAVREAFQSQSDRSPQQKKTAPESGRNANPQRAESNQKSVGSAPGNRGADSGAQRQTRQVMPAREGRQPRSDRGDVQNPRQTPQPQQQRDFRGAGSESGTHRESEPRQRRGSGNPATGTHATGNQRLERPQRQGRPLRTPDQALALQRPQKSRSAQESVEPSDSGDTSGRAEHASDRPHLGFDSTGVMELLQDYTARFLGSFGVTAEHYTLQRTDTGDVLITTDDEFLESLLARSDKLSGAFEHVFKRLAQRKLGDVSGRVLLDAGGAQETRADRLTEMALSLAEKVKKTGKTVTLASKSSQERRVMHLALDGYEGVGTRSVGSGENRKLVIFSTERAARGRGGSSDTGRNQQGAAAPESTDMGDDAAARLASEGARALSKPTPQVQNERTNRRTPRRKGGPSAQGGGPRSSGQPAAQHQERGAGRPQQQRGDGQQGQRPPRRGEQSGTSAAAQADQIQGGTAGQSLQVPATQGSASQATPSLHKSTEDSQD